MNSAARRWVLAIAFSSALAASGCAAITPASDNGQSGQSDADQDGTDQSDPDQGDAEQSQTDADNVSTTTTVELPDPIWAELALDLVPIAEVEEPVAFTSRSGTPNYYVVERAGRIRVIDRTVSPNGTERISLSSRPMLDLSERISIDGEGGLLGLAFSTDGRFLYVSYTDLSGNSVVSEFDVSRSDRADPEAERVLLQLDQPFNNHNGGGLKIGEDGFLYIGFGDGGGAGDPEQAGQDRDTLLGKILRIDPVPDGDTPYTIPNGNPFYDDDNGRPEIWLWGVRNPWRFSFDSGTGDLWIADVGQDAFEEINLLKASTGGGWKANLGWSLMEGTQSFEGGSEPDDHHAPVYAYPHEDGRCSVTGGMVYRGEIIALLQGVYVFGDFCSGEILGLEILPDGVLVRPLSISVGTDQVASFGEGPDGELFVLARDGGTDGLGVVYRVEPTQAEANSGS